MGLFSIRRLTIIYRNRFTHVPKLKVKGASLKVTFREVNINNF